MKPTIEYLKQLEKDKEIQDEINKKEQERIELAFSLGICPECGENKIKKNTIIRAVSVFICFKCKKCKFKHSTIIY
jgi:predicted RNA-binding Zn-ribbon protein involved in translation (DUF1610 family)